MAVTIMTGKGRREVSGAGASRCDELLERDQELEALRRSFEAAKNGSGSTVMVSGTAGVGKTSLVKAFVSSLEDDETPQLLWGGCDDLIAPRPFGPFLDMVHATGLLPDELAASPNREDLLVNLQGILDRPSRPAVVVIEDAHWADDASVDVMRYLARRIESLHALMIVTSRDGEGGGSHAVRGLLTGSSSSAPLRLDLGPLSPEAVATMGRGSSIDAKHLHEVSGGNPLLVSRLLTVNPDEAARMARETLMSRTEHLSVDGRAALQALSVLPDGADPSLARTLFADRPQALHEAETTGLLTSSHSHIGFRHELARTAVAESMSFGERMAATDRVLSALTETGEDPKVLVHIARAAGDGPRATAFALDALDHGLAPNDHVGAWTMARIALECTTNLDDARVGRLHLAAATAGRASGQNRAALRHAERAVQRLSRSAPDEPDGEIKPAQAADLVAAWVVMADLQGDAGDNLVARSTLRRAGELLQDEDGSPIRSREWVWCNTRLANSARISTDLTRAVELATASIEVAEANRWSEELIHALTVRGTALGGVSNPEGMEDLTLAKELAVTAASPHQHLSTMLDLAECHMRAAQSAEAEQLAGEVERLGREHQLERLRYRAASLLAQTFLHRGRTVEAEKLARSLLAEELDPGLPRAAAEAVVARILVRRGDDQVGDTVDQVWNMAVKAGDIGLLAFTGVTRLEHRWVVGDEKALRQFARYLSGLGERHRHHRLRAEGLRVLQRLGDDLGFELPEEPPTNGEDSDPEDTAGENTAGVGGMGDGDRVAVPFEGCPPPLAAALYGDHKLAADRWEQAGEPFGRALELIESSTAAAAFEGLRLLDRTGATRTADLARHRLRGRGLQGVPRGPRRSADGGIPILTGRQIEVLKLIARGNTNAEIADELYVARRTVDNHVSAILSRLGVDRRSQAVEVAVSRGMIDV